jgi:DNA-binding NarL/FixJ family response regulator
LRPTRILVVDDFADWRRYVLEKLRENRGWQVIDVASDGLEAVQKAEELLPDLILLDIGMPELDGIEAARHIRKVSPKCKILFLTQELDADVARAALSAGGHGYVIKSDAEGELFAAVEAVLLGKTFVSARLADQAAENSMAAYFRIDAERRLVMSTATGVFTLVDGLAHQEKLVNDPDFDPSFSQLIDFTHVTKLETGTEDVRRLAQRSVFASDARRAILVDDDVIFGSAQKFVTFRESLGEQGLRVFRSIDEALSWVLAGNGAT